MPEAVGTAVRQRPLIWLEAYSGGEISQCVSLVQRLKARLPGCAVVVATNNPHSHARAVQIPGVDTVVQCPWDLPWVARRTLRQVRPSAIVCMENPMFPVFIREASRLGIPTLVCSGFMSKGYERHWAVRRTIALGGFRCLTAIGAKEPQDAEGYARLGVDPSRIQAVGNLKFDRDAIRLSEADRAAWRAQLGLDQKAPVWVAGSVHAGEDALVLDAYEAARRRHPALRLILALSFNSPGLDTEAVLRQRGIPCVRRSQMAPGEPLGERVLLLDSFGELGRLYGLATLIFVGASIVPYSTFGYGHNMVEPLMHERPILFGPFMNHWREITDEFKQEWSGVEVADGPALTASVLRLLDDGPLRRRLGERARRILDRFDDPVERYVDFIASYVPQSITRTGSQAEEHSVPYAIRQP